MINPIIFLGLPLDFSNICKIYPPKVKDIVTQPKIVQLYKLLTYSQEDIEDLLTSIKKDKSEADEQKIPTPLEFILINSYQSKEFEALIQQAFLQFIHESVTFVYENKLLLIGEIEDITQITDLHQCHYLSEENFFDFQNLIRQSMGDELIEPPSINDSPVVKRIKAAARRRKRLAEKNKSKKGISLTTSLGAICCMGIGLTPLNIGEISYASIDVIMSLYQQKEKYQTDIDSLMAGADPKKVHPKYWIRDNSNENEI